MGTTTPGTGRTTGVTALVALLWVSWLLAPLGLAVWSVLATWHLYGEPPSPEEQRQALAAAWAAGGLAVALPLAGLLVSIRAARPAGAAAFATALVLGTVAAWLVVGPSLPQEAPPEPAPPGCQERSGGDTDCPGG